MQTLLFVGFVLGIAWLSNTILTAVFSLEHYNTHKKRQEQLKFNNKKNSDKEDMQNLINTITKPAITYIFPMLKKRDEKELNRDLALAGWGDYFDANTYTAMSITLKIIGFIVLILLFPLSKAFAIVWFLALFFLFDFLFKNSLKEKKMKLLIQFPDFIRIIQGYLVADMTFTRAIEESIQYVGEDWRVILEQFALDCEVKSIKDAIENLVEKTNIVEVRELFSIIKLNLEQGINIKESFESQVGKVREMQLMIFESKIRKRQLMCTMLQAPILLCIFGAFGLPTVYSMINLSSMN
ncbi:hypothetical protein BFS06_12115 [Clostridium perfringens]|uniref:Type II secretion system protein GspF domain-containing protein n=1 Tax=Clostridium perfringens TaxID=1502 RepID=A0A140GQZ1_CLOPF|nr:hypothetical protein [Clostridium perfringens]AMN30950.1 hypothetical protein JFP838_pA0034 [Clostridium perfringens]TBX14946.1 hypothetical protein BFS06_12115 [Clostridium perfringens]